MEQNIFHIIPIALQKYDENNKKYKKLFKTFVKKEFIRMTSDIEKNIIIFKDINGKEIKRSRYEMIGIYNKIDYIWIWAWALPSIYKNEIYLAKTMLNYGLDIIPYNITNHEIDDDKIINNNINFLNLKSQLINSRFKIYNILQLDIHLALSSYLTKIPIIYPYQREKDIIEYFFLLDF